MNSLRYTFKMPDGSFVEVDNRTYLALHQLQDALVRVATNQLSNFSLIEVDKQGRDSSFMLLGACENLEVLHRELTQQGAVALELAKSWQGNVDPEHRSQSRH